VNPLQIWRKFSAVLGTTSPNNLITKRPAGVPFLVMSKNTKLGTDNGFSSATAGLDSNAFEVRENELGANGVVLVVNAEKADARAGNADVDVVVTVEAEVGANEKADTGVVFDGNAEVLVEDENAEDGKAEAGVLVEDGNAETGVLVEEGKAETGMAEDGKAEAGVLVDDGNAENADAAEDGNEEAGGANAEGKLDGEKVDCGKAGTDVVEEDGEPKADLKGAEEGNAGVNAEEKFENEEADRAGIAAATPNGLSAVKVIFLEKLLANGPGTSGCSSSSASSKPNPFIRSVATSSIRS